MELNITFAVGVKPHGVGGVDYTGLVQIAGCVGLRPQDNRSLDARRDGKALFHRYLGGGLC